MLDGRPCPSPLSRPPGPAADVGEGDESLCGRPTRPRKPNGRPPHRPTKESRKFVAGMITTLNVTHRQVAQVMGLAVGTLRKHYREELDRAKLEVDIAVGETIVAKCLGGIGKDRDWQKADSNLLKFYAVTQLGWREKADVELGGQLTVKIGREFDGV